MFVVVRHHANVSIFANVISASTTVSHFLKHIGICLISKTGTILTTNVYFHLIAVCACNSRKGGPWSFVFLGGSFGNVRC